MLSGRSGLPAEGGGWMVEPKWDGVRAIVTISDGAVRLMSRNDRDVSGAYPELALPPPGMHGRAAVFDGEVVAIDARGRPSFGLLQHRMHVRRPPAALVGEVPVTLVLFDVLWLDGDLLVGEAQQVRRRILDGLGIASPPWVTSPVLDLGRDEVMDTCRETGMEGVVFKRADARYLPGQRSEAWVKVKCVRRREFVVGGWSEGKGGRSGYLGSLALGVHDAGGLRFVGMVGSGLSGADIDAFRRAAGALDRDDSPFTNPTPPGLKYLDPALVAEVTFSEVTAAGTLRHPVLEGFRTDIVAADVVVDAELFPTES